MQKLWNILIYRGKIMENKQNNEQIIELINKQRLTVGGTDKVISLKPDLIQLNTILGGVIITGDRLELIKLDDQTKKAEISGEINSLKFVEGKSKQSFFRKIFK